MTSFIRFIFAVALSLGMVGQTMAHEFLIKPESWNQYKAGQRLSLSVYSTHFFMKGEEIEDPKTVQLSYAGENIPLTPNQALLTQDGSITLKAGTAAIIEGHRLPILWSETPNGGAEGGRSKHPDAITAASYEKFVRLILPVNGNTNDFNKISGHKLEIVPLSNPLTAKIGDELRFRVLLNGKPAAFERIEATYDGFTDTPSAWAYSAAPIQHGEAIVKITASGLWMLRVGITLPNKTAEYDEEILIGILIFPVK
ncbi:MAG: DUF4198 domain-containing protein [Saezia sp.]